MRLKELNWNGYGNDGMYADTPFGMYFVLTQRNTGKCEVSSLFDREMKIPCTDYEDGKVKAADDLRKRVSRSFMNSPWIKVRLREMDLGGCREIWEAEPTPEGSELRLVRLPNQEIKWHYLNDTHGTSQQINDPVRKNIVLILCDENWNELFRESNDRKRYPKSYESKLPGM